MSNNQGNLFDGYLSALGIKDTSIEAFFSIDFFRGDLRKIVFQVIHESWGEGMTREEIAFKTGLAGSTVRPRVWEMLHHDPALLTEGPDQRPTCSGRLAFILRVREKE